MQCRQGGVSNTCTVGEPLKNVLQNLQEFLKIYALFTARAVTGCVFII